MTRILVEESELTECPGFWARQFALEKTRSQDTIDFVFGIFLPVICFYFDPIVFRGGMLGNPLLARYQLIAYAVSLIQIPVLATWLLFGRQLRSFSAPIGGVLVAGSVFSVAIGGIILPFTLLGLIFLVGFLGFTPFLTGFVYLRNGWRALSNQDRNFTYPSRLITAALAGILSIAVPVFADRIITETTLRSTQLLINGNRAQVEIAVNQMRWMPFIPQESLQSIISAYQSSTDKERKELLKKAYWELAGEDIDVRIAILND